MTDALRIAVAGLGTVGTGALRILEEQAALVKIYRRLGLEPAGAGTFAASRR